MTENKDLKYIQQLTNRPYIPETKTEIVLNDGQQQSSQQNEQKSTVEKVAEAVSNAPAAVKEAIIPTVYASDGDDGKEGAKQVVGAELAVADAVAPPVGAVASVVTGIAGAVVEGVGKMTGNEDAQNIGEVWKEAPLQPVKEAGKAVKKAAE